MERPVRVTPSYRVYKNGGGVLERGRWVLDTRGSSRLELQGESDGSHSSDTLTHDTEARNDFWTIAGIYVYRHHVEPRVELYVPAGESVSKPLRCIDVATRTNTTLDVLLESRKDDHRNVDGDRHLSEPWTGFTQFTILNETPPDGRMSSGGRLTKIQATTRTDYLWPKIWSSMS